MHSELSQGQLLKTLGIVCGGGLFAGMILLCLFLISELSRLANDNTVLLAEKRAIDIRLSEVERSFTNINAYSDTLDQLTLATVSPDSDHSDTTSEKIAEIREALQRIRRFASVEEAHVNLIHRADDVVADTGRLEQTLRNLVSILEHRREILDATPTLTPTTGWISSFYGERHSPFSGKNVLHRGIDIGAEHGTPIYAPADGVVDVVGSSPSFGNFLVLQHPYGIMTKYAHNSVVKVEKGDRVRRGQVIAEVGSTGMSTGPHLHYEVWVGDKAVDPRNFLLDQKLKVVNLAANHSIGGEEFALEEANSRPNAMQKESTQRRSSESPMLSPDFKGKKQIGIVILILALGLLSYLFLMVIKDRQERDLFSGD